MTVQRGFFSDDLKDVHHQKQKIEYSLTHHQVWKIEQDGNWRGEIMVDLYLRLVDFHSALLKPCAQEGKDN